MDAEHNTGDDTQGISHILESDEYTRERLQPNVRGNIYLHLADLREALDPFATAAPVRLLDYGCGGSPYRSLFPNATYIRADFTPCTGLDFLLPADSTIPPGADSFDMVLSTQVLEHVSEPAHYISECFRVLNPGGSLLLTTHGLYEEHGCPYDFQRWTADGLRLLLEKAGFEVAAVQKLTCGPRAICFFVNNGLSHLRAPKTSPFGFAMWMLRGLRRIAPGWLNRAADRHFKEYSIADSTAPGANLYIALLIHARRPAPAVKSPA